MANDNNLINYLKIYKAAIEDDWGTAKCIFEKENYDLYTYFLYDDSDTPLHIAVGTNSSHSFVQELVDWIMDLDDPQMLRICNNSGNIALHKEAQQWMKDTSSSATVVAALIVTIAFAAIFTVPGGNNDNGKPLFSNNAVFILFAISDAIALFSSSTSVIMLLAVLNSRFAEVDFLYSLPKRLTLGLISLFISIDATMVAFSATLSLVLGDKIQRIAAPVVLLASVPVTLFLLLQYPLLVEMVRSTYGRGIFYRQNKLLLH